MEKNNTFPQFSIDAIEKCINAEHVSICSTSHLVFTCGANPDKSDPDKHEPSGRDRLMEYAERYIKDCYFFMAEVFFERFNNTQKIDLLTMENRLAEYSDCIIIVLESQSTFAELGAFSMEDTLAENILVVNDNNFKDSESFINMGPIAKLDKMSRFKPRISAKSKGILSVAKDIEDRLARIKKTYKKKYIKTFLELKPKDRMFFISDLISLFHPIAHTELIYLLKKLYGNLNFDIVFDISLLRAIGIIKKVKENNKSYYMESTNNKGRFFKFNGVNEIITRAAIVNHYHKYKKEKIVCLRKKVGMK